jgi:RNA-directed DNA polymerase
MGFVRVAGDRGAMTAGVDGWTVATVEDHLGVRGFLDDLRTQLKTGTFWPLPVYVIGSRGVGHSCSVVGA